jgi:hypothetical protein
VGPRFAPGDQVIARTSDHRAAIYNRERWRLAEARPRNSRNRGSEPKSEAQAKPKEQPQLRQKLEPEVKSKSAKTEDKTSEKR